MKIIIIIIFTIILSLNNAYHLNIKNKISPSINYRYNCHGCNCKRYATNNDEITDQDTKRSTKPKQANVELFAAANRKTPIISKSGTVSQSNEKYSTEQSKTTVTSSGNISSTSNITDISIGGSSSIKIRNDLISKQAELLRIEAEKEQLLIDNERIAQEKVLLISIDGCLLQLLNEQVTINDIVTNRKELLNKELFFRIIELINAEMDQNRKKKLFTLYDNMMESIDLDDHSLFIDINASIQKEIKLENSKTQAANTLKLKSNQENVYNGTDQAYDEILKQWMAQIDKSSMITKGNTSDNIDTTSILIPPSSTILNPEDLRKMMLNGSTNVNLEDAFTGRAMLRFPAAMPLNMMPLILRSSEIPSTDLDIIKNAIFTSDILNQTIFDGSNYLTTIRGVPIVSAKDTFDKANERLANNFPSINERVRLFMLPEYRIPPKSLNVQIEKYSGSTYEPIFVLVSKEAQPKPPTGIENAGSAIAFIASLVTMFIYATDVNSFNPNFVQQALAGDETVVNRVFYITFGVLLVQCLHDLGHYAAASIHRTKLSFPPIYLPSLQIGLFGSITRFLSFPKNRKELFDVSIAGPLCGYLASLISTFLGLSYTSTATVEELATYPALPSGFFKVSYLINELVDKFLHISQLPDQNSLVSIHPLLTVGLVGLIVNAFNFMPIGRLDGGRVIMAIAGRNSANGVAFAALIAQGVSLLTASSPISLYWILAVVILQRGADLPPIDDITPIATDEDDKNKDISWFLRASALFFCVLLTAGILLPVPTDLSTIANDISNIISSPSSLQAEPPIIPPGQWI